MKKLIYTITIIAIIVVTPIYLSAQTKPYDMIINGVKVIVQPAGNQIAVIQTIIKGGVQNYSNDKAGIENLAIRGLTECGTVNDDKDSFKDKLDKVSAQINGFSNMDYASFSLNCIKPDLEKVWSLYTDALLSPRFDAKEFDRIKQDAINFIKTNESFPDFAINKMAKETAFNGKNYAKTPEGTVSSVETINTEEVKKYWQSVFTRSRIIMVVVADLEKPVIEKMLNEFLSKVPAGTPFVAKKDNYAPASNTFIASQRDNATNYVQGITGGPKPGSPDYNAFVLAMRIFGTRHWVEIRAKNGLSYAPRASFNGGNTAYSTITVSTTEPNKYIAAARQLIDKVKKEGFDSSELKNEKTGYLTGIYFREETNEEQAASLALNEVIFGNWKRSISIRNEINKVSLAEIDNAFKKYIGNITWVYQGDPQKVNAAMYTQKATPRMPEEKKAF